MIDRALSSEKQKYNSNGNIKSYRIILGSDAFTSILSKDT